MNCVYKFIFGLLPLFSFISCCRTQSNELPLVVLEEGSDLVFELDDITVESMEYSQYFQRNDSNIFSFTNRYDNSIVFYDYKSRKYLSRIAYYKEGGDGIGEVFSYYYHNADSIYHYHYNLHIIFRTNSMGRVMEKHLLHIIPDPSPDSLFLAPTLFPRTNSPIRQLDNLLLVPGLLMAEVEGENGENRPVMTYLNLLTREITHSDSYPLMYHNDNWGGDLTWRMPYYTLSPDKELVLSFPADHNIRVHKLYEENYKEYYAGTGDTHAIPPLEYGVVNFKPIDPKALRRHYVENLSYGAILYDKYRKVYYRIAKLPDSSIDIHKRPLRKPIEVIVLNDKFEIIGKSPLKNDRYWINQSFVGEEGLHIQVQSDNEDELRFKTFILDENAL